MLDRLAGPHHVEAGVRKWPWTLERHDAKIELRVARATATQRLLRHVHPDDEEAGTRELGRELTFTATDVQHPARRLSRYIESSRMLQQECEPHVQIGRIEALGQRPPEALVVVAQGDFRARLGVAARTG